MFCAPRAATGCFPPARNILLFFRKEVDLGQLVGQPSEWYFQGEREQTDQNPALHVV